MRATIATIVVVLIDCLPLQCDPPGPEWGESALRTRFRRHGACILIRGSRARGG